MGGRGGEPGSIRPGPKAAPVEFEWDPAKSASNKRKHGIDFEQAQAIWEDPGRVRLQPRSSAAELR